VVEVQRGNDKLAAVHVRGDMPRHRTCPHCGLGQVLVRKGFRCSCCGATVTDIRERQDAVQQELFR